MHVYKVKKTMNFFTDPVISSPLCLNVNILFIYSYGKIQQHNMELTYTKYSIKAHVWFYGQIPKSFNHWIPVPSNWCNSCRQPEYFLRGHLIAIWCDVCWTFPQTQDCQPVPTCISTIGICHGHCKSNWVPSISQENLSHRDAVLHNTVLFTNKLWQWE